MRLIRPDANRVNPIRSEVGTKRPPRVARDGLELPVQIIGSFATDVYRVCLNRNILLESGAKVAG